MLGEKADLRRDNEDIRDRASAMRDRARAESQAADSWQEQCVSLQTTCEVATKYLQRYRYSKDEKDLKRALHALAPSSSSLAEGMRVQVSEEQAWDHLGDIKIEGIIEEITPSGIANVRRTANELRRVEVERLTPVKYQRRF